MKCKTEIPHLLLVDVCSLFFVFNVTRLIIIIIETFQDCVHCLFWWVAPPLQLFETNSQEATIASTLVYPCHCGTVVEAWHFGLLCGLKYFGCMLLPMVITYRTMTTYSFAINIIHKSLFESHVLQFGAINVRILFRSENCQCYSVRLSMWIEIWHLGQCIVKMS